jgi:hypothetical protein
MGNTILSHILYSCGKIDLDLNNFFSPEGNAHAIQSCAKNFELVAKHLVEFPSADVNCLIELTTDGWTTILKHKMSYAKWFKKCPQANNYNDFFKIKIDQLSMQDTLWQEFYAEYKDPQWPECNTFDDLNKLPPNIQDEILQVYMEPNKNLSVLNLLTISYFDQLVKPHVSNFPYAIEYKLEDYLNGIFDPLKNVICNKFNWTWDDQLSTNFHQQVLKVNFVYTKWLDNIVDVFNHCINFTVTEVTLEFWEQAILLAKICQHFNIHPNCLNWSKNHCFLEKNNVSLLLNLKEVNNGQTI